MNVTKELILSFKPCEDYNSEEKLEPFFKKRKWLRHSIIANMKNVPVDDRVWLLLKLLKSNAKSSRLFACDCVERVLNLQNNPDERYLKAIEISRAFAEGKASKEELRKNSRISFGSVADSYAACAVANATYYAVDAEATNAYCAAAEAAEAADATYTDFDKEREWQVQRIVKYLDD